MKRKWTNLNEELKQKLKEHKYSFIETWKLVGCGEKTLRRYMDAGLIMPLKKSDEWLFSEKLIEKTKFIYELKSQLNVNVKVAAGLYDFLDGKRYIKPDYEKIIELSQNY